jgi:hypothetical protein
LANTNKNIQQTTTGFKKVQRENLIHLLKDPDERVRINAERALKKINTPDARRALRYGIQKYF